MTGTVIFFNNEKGYGFIAQDQSKENIFFHITNCNLEEVPEAQMRVQYAISEGRKGDQAVNVSIL